MAAILISITTRTDKFGSLSLAMDLSGKTVGNLMRIHNEFLCEEFSALLNNLINNSWCFLSSFPSKTVRETNENLQLLKLNYPLPLATDHSPSTMHSMFCIKNNFPKRKFANQIVRMKRSVIHCARRIK